MPHSWPRPTCSKSGRPRSWPPTGRTSRRPRPAGMEPGPLDRLRLTDARIGGHGDRPAPGGRAPGPGRRGPRRLAAPERARDPAGPGAARRRGDHLREPPQRDLRCGRALPEVRQRGAPAGERERAADQPGDRRRPPRGLRQGRAARGRARAGRRPVARDRDRGHAAHGVRRLPDPAGRAVADRAASARTRPSR